jgi:ArsR family transcriptional regulator
MRRKPSLSDGCADKLRILADKTRLAALEILMAGPRTVNGLNELLRIEQSLLSHHLRVLRDAGLVIAEREGRSVVYHVNPEVASRRGKMRALDLGCCSLSF